MNNFNPYVYKLTHKVTGQYYFGFREGNKTSALEDLPKYQSSSKKVKEMGFENFYYEIIAGFDGEKAGDQSYDLEQKLIEDNWGDPLLLNEHFRKRNGDKRFKLNNKGKSYEELYGEERAKEIKRKKSEKMKGENNPFFENPDAAKALVKFAKNKIGKSLTEIYGETKAKDITTKQIAGQIGSKRSLETKLKMSKSSKGKPKSEAHRVALKGCQLGRKDKDETRRKKSASHIGIKQTPESIQKMLRTRAERKQAKEKAPSFPGA